MDDDAAKQDLLRYLQRGRAALIGKLDGLSEYDARRPLTPTGTNLAGLVKHVAFVQAGYLGGVFDRPFPDPSPWELPGGADDDDMWLKPEESLESLRDLWQRSCDHADATIEALPLDATGRVPWWGDAGIGVSLHRILVHHLAELDRHCGQADILRETIDAVAGHDSPGDNLPERDAEGWATFRRMIEDAARSAAG